MKRLPSIKTLLAAGMLAAPLLAINVQAQFDGVREFKPSDTGSTSGLWSDPTSWIPAQTVPDAAKETFFKWAPQIACVLDVAATPGRVNMGDNGDGGVLIITNGGSLAPVTSYMAIGYSRNAQVDVYTGGSLTTPSHLWVGLLTPAVGTLNIHGGTVTVNEMFGVGWDTGTGHVHVDGGLLDLHQFHPSQSIKAGSTVDVTGGTISIIGNRVTDIDNYTNTLRLTAYGGAGVISRNFDSGLNRTIVTAIAPGGGSNPPPQTVASITSSGDNVTVTYHTTPGFPYHLETSASAAPTSWSLVPGSAVGRRAGTSETFTTPRISDFQIFRSVSP